MFSILRMAGIAAAMAALFGCTATSMQGYADLDRLWARGRDILGCDLAIMGGAMTWVSERNLVAAISNAGGFGVIASGSMSPELLATEIGATQAMTTRPFGVNLIIVVPVPWIPLGGVELLKLDTRISPASITPPLGKLDGTSATP